MSSARRLGQTLIENTTDAGSFGDQNASMVTKGGAVIQKSLYVSGAINLNANMTLSNAATITGLPTPVNASDAVNKAYTDLNSVPGTVTFVGDTTGASDVTSGLNAAITTAATLGKIVLVPQGVYLVNGTVTVASGVTLRGYATQTGTGDGALGTIFKITSTNTSTVISMGANATIENIEFNYTSIVLTTARVDTTYGTTIVVANPGVTVRNIRADVAPKFLTVDGANCRVSEVQGYPKTGIVLSGTTAVTGFTLDKFLFGPTGTYKTTNATFQGASVVAILNSGMLNFNILNGYIEYYGIAFSAVRAVATYGSYGSLSNIKCENIQTSGIHIGEGGVGLQALKCANVTIRTVLYGVNLQDGSAGQTSSGEFPTLLLANFAVLPMPSSTITAPINLGSATTARVTWKGGVAEGIPSSPIVSNTASSSVTVRLSGVFSASSARLPSVAMNIEDLQTNTQAYSLQTDGSVLFYNTTNATGVNTGGLQTKGGFSTTKDLYVGNKLQIANTGFSYAPSATAGAVFNVPPVTITDGTTATSSFTAAAYPTFFGVPTLSATNSTVTTLVAATVAIAGAPTNGTNNSITTAYALQVLAGRCSFSSSDFIVSGVAINPNTEDIVKQPTAFTAANAQLSAASVTGCVFPSSRSVWVTLTAVSLTGGVSDQYAVHDIRILRQGAGCLIYDEFTGDDIGLVFSVTSGGQLQYTSPTIPNYVSLSFSFRAETIA